jgi:hypothetical protein
MNKKEKIIYKMHKDLVAYVAKEQKRADKSPAFCRFIQNLDAELQQVHAADTQAQQSTKGATKAKNALKTDAKNATKRIAKILVAHAADVNDSVLKDKYKGLKNKIGQASNVDFTMKCKDVMTEARLVEKHLLDHGITAEDLATVEAKIALLDTKLPEHSGVKVDKKAGTQKRKQLFTNIQSVSTEQVKNAVATFIDLDKEFYDGVMGIITPPKVAQPTQIRVVFKSADTKNPLMHHTARLLNAETMEKSDKRGAIRFKFDKGGFHTIEVQLPSGEIRIFKDIEVKQGKTKTLKIEV